ncbi:MAG: hypothetical protein AAFZ18_01570 [Myxococcota bacterium]
MKGRSRRRGFSLLETLTGLALGTFVSVGALVLTSNFQRFSHRHVGEIETSQGLRRALDLMSEDLRNAGVGVGYMPDGTFSGLLGGAFSLPGGASFSANNRAIKTVDGSLLTDDLGVRRALGRRRTIAYLDGGYGEVCRGLNLAADDIVSVVSRSGLAGRTLRIVSASATTCSRNPCSNGCQGLSFASDPSYLSDPSALSRRFTAGDMFQEYETVVWFIAVDADGFPSLRRVGGAAIQTCAAADESCGGEVGEGVEFIQMAWWRLDSSGAWVSVSHDSMVQTEDPLKVDVEIVTRTRQDPGVGRSRHVESEIETGLCVPAHCGRTETPDRVPRTVLRTSIEVRNAGRLRIR